MDSREAEAYKEMYLKMARAAEKAIDLLVEAQRECEEMYLAAGEDEEEQVEQNGGPAQ